jgi:N6-L-threonylcarbamoyladenine synthase
MDILALETSCDETAVSFVHAEGDSTHATFSVFGDALYSQAKKHASYGGVFPSLAKREHTKNIIPLLSLALREAGRVVYEEHSFPEALETSIKKIFTHEEGLAEELLTYARTIRTPKLDAIAITHGPGLEPALWVGVNVARALALLWNIPLLPVNHLEGHLVASAVSRVQEKPYPVFSLSPLSFPAVGLILSGGHTEFVHIDAWGSYTTIGRTRDDSVGEAYDKVARLLGIPYPGGPGLSALASHGREKEIREVVPFPRPMLTTPDLDFSFSGIKTSVLYRVKERGELTERDRIAIATSFEDAVTEVILKKTVRALAPSPEGGVVPHAFLLGGGVSANGHLRTSLSALCAHYPDTSFHLPAQGLSTDNAVMIALAGYLAHLRNTPPADPHTLVAHGSLNLEVGTKK